MSAARRVRLKALIEDSSVNKTIRIIKKDENHYNANEFNECIGDPEESIKTLEKIRDEAMVLLYGNKSTFQRTINVVKRK